MAPSLAGQFVALIKDSSVIGVSELTLAAQEVNAFTDAAFESDLPLAAGYLAFTLPLSLWPRFLERRLRFDT
jgi:polar amino acid transport system permease protein